MTCIWVLGLEMHPSRAPTPHHTKTPPTRHHNETERCREVGDKDNEPKQCQTCRLGLYEFFFSSLFMFLILLCFVYCIFFFEFFKYFIPRRSRGDLLCNTNVLQPNAKSATIRTCPNIVQPPHRLKTCPWTVEDTARKKWPRETQDDNHHIDTGN